MSFEWTLFILETPELACFLACALVLGFLLGFISTYLFLLLRGTR